MKKNKGEHMIKRLLFIVLAVALFAGSVCSKEKKLTDRQTKIAQFKKERKNLLTRANEYADAIQNIKYRIAQLNFGIELLEDEEKGKKNSKNYKKIIRDLKKEVEIFKKQVDEFNKIAVDYKKKKK